MNDLASWAARKIVEAGNRTPVCELKDLIGLHVLSGVDSGGPNEQFIGEYSEREYSGEVFRFVLDGVTFLAREDDNDGYRSAMRDITIDLSPVKNMFPPCHVMCSYKEASTGSACDLLEMTDTKTGKLVLIVGTSDKDDYYPSFTTNFLPENMAANKGWA